MTLPKYSFIVPVYNAEKYLLECIDSIRYQSVPDWELILVDDGSTDQSGLICDRIAAEDTRINVIHQKNAGVSNARNHGLEVAKGEKICFVDSDDWITSDYLKTLEEVEEDIDIVFFPFVQVYEGGQRSYKTFKKQTARGRENVETVLFNLKHGPLDDMFGWTVVKCIKLSIIKEHKIRFIESLQICEDLIFSLEVCRYISSIFILDVPLYNYRMLNVGLSNNPMSPQCMFLLANNIEKNIPYYRHEAFINEEKKIIVDYRLEHFAKTVHIRTLFKDLKQELNYFEKNKDLLPLASNERLASFMSHSFVRSYILLLIDMSLNALRGRL